jgi:hypothetical protein
MNKNTTIFLQIVVVLIGIGVLALLLIEPRLEGVNAHATSFADIYLDDPFLAYAYLGSLPFFFGLYQAFKILSYIRHNKTFSQQTLKALRIIKRCTLITGVAIVGADTYLRFAAMKSNDDPAGAIALGMAATLVCIVVAVVATMFERIIKASKELHA